MRQADSPVLIRTGERKSEEKARQETTYYLSWDEGKEGGGASYKE